MKSIVKQAEEIHKRVDCGYLSVSLGTLLGAKGASGKVEIMAECHNVRCGPKHGCDILEGNKCKYRSKKVNPTHLYASHGFDVGKC